jgi:hypothetical protein
MSMIWLAADYHFPSTYSCRIPMSSMSSAWVAPAPGPATVRLALIRRGIELFGIARVRDELFPTIRSLSVRVQPPERVAISLHRLRAHKWERGKGGKGKQFQESVIVREMAHAQGPMTVYIEIPSRQEEVYWALLRAIGYWGQTNSLAYCVAVREAAPQQGMCAMPLNALGSSRPLRPFFSCLLTEFRTRSLEWHEVVPASDSSDSQALRLDIYVWPMLVEHRSGEGKLLVRHALL